MAFRFAFVADTHYLAGAAANSDRDFQRLTDGDAIYAALLRQLRQFEPAFVVHGGDVVSSSAPYNTPDDQLAESLRRVRRWGDSLGVPWRYVLGNHDVATGSGSRLPFLTILGDPQHPLPPSHPRVPPDPQVLPRDARAYASYVHEDIRLILLDTLDGEPAQRYALNAAQLSWLDHELRAAAGAGQEVLLFSHVLLDPGPFASFRWLRHVAVDNPADVFGVLDRYDHVRAVFIGHLHRNQVFERRGVYHVMSPATICYPMMWRAVTVEDDCILVQSRQLDLPDVLAASYAARPAVADEQMGKHSDREFIIRRPNG
jgi:3',5'-cyclic AMP phosphodiesterase CpdA